MKKIFLQFSFLILSVLLISNIELSAQENINKAEKLTHWMTPDELLRKHEIGKDFTPTDPPEAPVRNIAEFNQMQGVLVRYPFGISYNVIKEMAEDMIVTTIVANQSQQNYVTTQYTNAGVNLNNCNFLLAPSDSYWSRDYGPWFVVDGNNNFGVMDFPYNRPRPNDNNIPVEVAEFLGIDLYGMDVIHAGGNYMTDGMGISASSELVWEENPSLTHEQIDQYFEDYLGIHTYHVIPDPNNTYIDHIDCWGKFLDVDKVLIRSVPEYHPQYDEIEATAAYFTEQISSYGVPYQVFRVYTPNNQPYTNSLILNKKVLVPITGSSWDDDAIALYQEAMPGYEILGFTGSWEPTDALHCRAKGIADLNDLYINHIPLLGDVPVQDEYQIEATIYPYSGSPLYPDSLFIYYSVNGSAYVHSVLTLVERSIYSGTIPGQGAGNQIEYYLYAADESGRNATHPFIGLPDPHVFNVEGSSQTISLSLGYQFISSNVSPEDPDLIVVLSDVLNENLDYVRNSLGQTLRKIGPNWVNNIGDWADEEGYLFKMTGDDSFTINGTAIEISTPIELSVGYQFISYFPVESMDALAAFAGILNDNLHYIRNSNGEVLRKIGPNWVNGIGNANPGEGYLVKMYASDVLIYPLSGEKASNIHSLTTPQHFIFEGGNAADPVYTIYVSGLETGDEVAAFDGEKLVGAMKITSEKTFENSMPVFKTLSNRDGFIEGNKLMLKVWSISSNREVEFSLNTLNPYGNAYLEETFPYSDGEYSVYNINKSTSNFNNERLSDVSVFPNPANDFVNIYSKTKIDRILILNTSGQVVEDIPVDLNNFNINVSNYESGVYFIKIVTLENIISKKILVN
jgi:agmatine deiminase